MQKDGRTSALASMWCQSRDIQAMLSEQGEKAVPATRYIAPLVRFGQAAIEFLGVLSPAKFTTLLWRMLNGIDVLRSEVAEAVSDLSNDVVLASMAASQ